MSTKSKYIIGAIVLLFIIVGMTTPETETNTNTETNATQTSAIEEDTQTRFTDRADIQREDIEILPGESATLDGVKMTIDRLEYKTAISDYEEAESGKTYLLATVTINNESPDTKSFNSLNFRVQTASGQVLDSTFVLIDNDLGSGDLVAGGVVSGVVPFEVPVETENQYIIWKPNAFDAARAIVQTVQK